ncbi:unnamed protein product [Calypogeia fissa]
MEEEKAAEYYNELLRKGGNAAKFKQGLGFGDSHHAPVSNEKEKYGSLSNFVKGSSTGKEAADLDKEIRIESVRDKLHKRDDSSVHEYRSSKSRHPDEFAKKSSDKTQARDHATRKTPDSRDSEEGKREKSRRHRRSPSLERTARASAQKPSDKERRGRSRSPSRRNGRKPSRSSSDDISNSKSSENRRKRSRRRGRDGSSSSLDDSRSRHERKRSATTRARSPSHSRGRDVDYRGRYRQRRAYSPHETRRRDRSRSSSPRRTSYRNYRENRSGRRSDSRHDSSRRRESDRRSSERQRDGRKEATGFSRGSGAKEKAPERDYSKLIPNFDTMTPAEKVKAKTKLQLSDAVTKDRTVGMSDEWERFDFDKNAPLDDDAKMDGFGDGTGAVDDTLFLKNTGSSFLSSSGQVTREALVTAKHEASIFGPLEGLPLKKLEPAGELVEGKKSDDGRESPPRDSGLVLSSVKCEEKDPQIATPSVNSVVSEQVIAMQQAGSWQDRARKMKAAREVALHH